MRAASMGSVDQLAGPELRARAAVFMALPSLRAAKPVQPARALYLVSRRPTKCDDCDPWEGKLLNASGRSGRRRVKGKNQVSGEVETVVVAGTVAQARQAGLFHPHCDHELIRYRHGVTKRPRRRKKVAS